MEIKEIKSKGTTTSSFNYPSLGSSHESEDELLSEHNNQTIESTSTNNYLPRYNSRDMFEDEDSNMQFDRNHSTAEKLNP